MTGRWIASILRRSVEFGKISYLPNEVRFGTVFNAGWFVGWSRITRVLDEFALHQNP